MTICVCIRQIVEVKKKPWIIKNHVNTVFWKTPVNNCDKSHVNQRYMYGWLSECYLSYMYLC